MLSFTSEQFPINKTRHISFVSFYFPLSVFFGALGFQDLQCFTAGTKLNKLYLRP